MTWQAFHKKLRALYLRIENSRLSPSQKESVYRKILEHLKRITAFVLADSSFEQANTYPENIKDFQTYTTHIKTCISHPKTTPLLLKTYSTFIGDVTESIQPYLR